MSLLTPPPRLPDPPRDYNQLYMDTLLRVIRLHFNEISAVGPTKALTTYFDTTQETPVTVPGQLAWSDFDGTLRLGMKGGNVVLEIGEEMFMRVSNDTGSLIEDGAAVGFAGVNGMRRIQVAPYLADGASNSLFFVGVATEDIPDGEQGFVTVYGRVRGIDTTGGLVSESWSVGDLLWAHPTIPGGLTKVKPTAPQNVISVAAVLAVDDTDGEIFVRPTIEQQQFYGVFAKTADQSPAAINTAYPVTFDTTRISNGVEIGTPTSRIVVPEAGLYQIAANVQLLSTNSSAKNVRFWFRKNGTDIPDTTRIVTTNINNGFVPLSLAEAVSLEADDYIELVFASNDTAVRLDAVDPTAFAPSAPAAVLELTQVQQ